MRQLQSRLRRLEGGRDDEPFEPCFIGNEEHPHEVTIAVTTSGLFHRAPKETLNSFVDRVNRAVHPFGTIDDLSDVQLQESIEALSACASGFRKLDQEASKETRS